MPAPTAGQDWPPPDVWLWCARIGRTRSTCSRLVAEGSFRVNRQPTDKPHARVRVGDILTFALGPGGGDRGAVRVWRVLALAGRRGPAQEAKLLYEDLSGESRGA